MAPHQLRRPSAPRGSRLAERPAEFQIWELLRARSEREARASALQQALDDEERLSRWAR
jgi:hypothetical protein